MTRTQLAQEAARRTRAAGGLPEGWTHDGWLTYHHKTTGAWFCQASARLHRPDKGGAYAYDVHEAAALLASGLRHA